MDNSTVLLVSGIFLDFAAGLILIFPILRFSIITTHLSNVQSALFKFGSLHSKDDAEAAKICDEVIYFLRPDIEEMSSVSVQTKRYEKELFPYGITFLGVGFVLIILGSLT